MNDQPSPSPPEGSPYVASKDHPASPDTARFGMWLFIAGLSMLFMASVIAYVILRFRAAEWPPPGTPAIPAGLWISTFVLLLSSATIHLATRAVTGRGGGQLRLWLGATLALGLVFLLLQVGNWMAYSVDYLAALENLPRLEERIPSEYPDRSAPDPRLFVFSYYSLTGVHAAHVVGGLIGLIVVLLKALRGAYSAKNPYAVQNMALYWHFLDVVWLVLFVLLVLKP